MNKKVKKNLKNVSKDKKSSADFLAGSDYVRKLYDRSLMEIFGKKGGLKVSKYLLEKSIKALTKTKSKSKAKK